jgi:formamidopyrimidine-DNA glycosylase
VGEFGSCPPFSRLAIRFSSGTLFLIDPRRFATFTLQPGGIPPALPNDPMEGLPVRHLREIAQGRRLPVKSFLLDQRLIAGIGNIYACEILFAAGIDPRRPSCSLTTAEWRKAAKAAAAILRRAVACRGTTVSDWRDLFGCSGTNQNHLEVYQRQGEPCRRCGGGIERIVQSGRGTWLCPICQK